MLAERRDNDGSRAEAAAALRERLQAADTEMEIPASLWERVRAADERAPRPRETRLSDRLGDLLAARSAGMRSALIAVAAVAVALVGGGSWWLLAPSQGATPAHRPSASASATPQRHTVTLRVHNIEKPCRKLHTLECALRLGKNPYRPYALGGNAAGHVWHGDKLAADCVVTDGRMVTDEHGLSSTRWYRVRTAHGKTGWLPGVRTRNSKSVPVCEGAERPTP